LRAITLANVMSGQGSRYGALRVPPSWFSARVAGSSQDFGQGERVQTTEMKTTKRALRTIFASAVIAFFLLTIQFVSAFAGGSLSGTLTDQTSGIVPKANLTLVNTAQKTEFKTVSDDKGFYSFQSLPVGVFDLTIEAQGFQTQKKTGITVDADSQVRLDVTLSVAQANQEVTVTEAGEAVSTQVETTATHLGEVVSGVVMEALPLNGRAYTDLLAIQPGVAPITSLTPTSVIMAGVTGTINPSGDANPGDLSISGQRESSNGFFVNGIDVQEPMNGGTGVIPNLDSISEFRVLTNNFDPQYGNYNGGLINVISKSGSNSFHGTAFEFLRNTDLDARNYFSNTRGLYQQNQYGGTVGGPVLRNKLFFFLDYQGTRTTQGFASNVTTVLSNQERAGNFSDAASSLNGTVGGTNTAQLLMQSLGYPVVPGEAYYTTGCTSTAQCVFPNAIIPQSAFSPVAKNLLGYIPTANIGSNLFETSDAFETVSDNKGGARLDGSTRLGQIFGYYFMDNYQLDNPYPGGQGGASIPGFDALTVGRSQLWTIGITKSIGANMVNQFNVGFLRNVNNIGQPHGGAGVSLASQGFVPGPANGGLVVQAPQYEGVENIVFPSFVMGVPITNTKQWNNTFYAGDTFTKVVGLHTLNFGVQYHNDQVNENPNATFNGTFSFFGTETGNPFADFVLGFPSNYTQTTGQRFYLRDFYVAGFANDSWRARSNLTFNLGLRWDLIRPWSEKYNNIQTYVAGAQSTLYPNAIPGLLVAGDPGIPSTLAPTRYKSFAPRVGVAWSPEGHSGFLKKLLGDGGKTSVRASYGIFYTAFPGLTAGIMYGVPPFGYNYLSPEPPEFAQPFINLADGTLNTDPYPFNFPPHGVSASKPYSAFNWPSVTPISADPYFYYKNQVPYSEDYMLSIQRQIGTRVLATVSYVGNQGHHLLVEENSNIGNPGLCLFLSNPANVTPGSATCGPYGEDGTYTAANGTVYPNTRCIPGIRCQGPNYGSNAADITLGHSNYNALQSSVRMTFGRTTALFSYTWSKSIDNASNLGEQIDPLNQRETRVISSFNIPNIFVASYNYSIPFDHWFNKRNRLTQGWAIAGTTRFGDGFPVTLVDDSDNSFLGTLGNGVNNSILDTPERLNSVPLDLNTNPRSNPYMFNPNAFAQEQPGQLGSAGRRIFQGPGFENFDIQISKSTALFKEGQSIDIRVEFFNAFNHAQFYGPQSVDGVVQDPTFGQVVSAANPRLIQIAAKIHF